MPLPLGSNAQELVQAASGPCLISNVGLLTAQTIYLDKRSFASSQSYTETIPAGSSLQWAGGELWGCCATGQSTMYTVMHGANLSGASASATAAAIYGTGSRLVDNSNSTKYTLKPTLCTYPTYPNYVYIDVSDALSLDILAYLQVDSAFPVTAGNRLWGTIYFMWQDALGAIIDEDAYELVVDRNATNSGLTSRYVRIRTPAIGSRVMVTMTWDSVRSASVNDQCKLRVVTSSRTTDRIRYSPGATPGYKNMGILADFQQVIAPATGARSAATIVEAFSGVVQVTLVAGSNAAVIAQVVIGADADISGSYFTVPLTAGQTLQLLFYLPHSHLIVFFATNTAGVAAPAYIQVVATDV